MRSSRPRATNGRRRSRPASCARWTSSPPAPSGSGSSRSTCSARSWRRRSEQLGNIFGDTAGQQIVGFGIGGVNINRGQFDSQAAFHRAINNLTININGSVLSDEDKIADAVHGAMQRNAQIGR